MGETKKWTKWDIAKGKLFYCYGMLWYPLFRLINIRKDSHFNDLVITQFSYVRHPLYELPQDYPDGLPEQTDEFNL